MKKKLLTPLYVFMLIALMLGVKPAHSAVWVISVAEFQFTPQSIPNVMVGDTIRWQWINGSHTTTSTSTPQGATAWDHAINNSSQLFEYHVMAAGTYNYVCTPHSPNMSGTFTASQPSGIVVINPTLVPLSVYPNPVAETMRISFNQNTSGTGVIKVFDLLGRESFAEEVELRPGGNVFTLPAADLTEGIYIVTLYNGNQR